MKAHTLAISNLEIILAKGTTLDKSGVRTIVYFGSHGSPTRVVFEKTCDDKVQLKQVMIQYSPEYIGYFSRWEKLSDKQRQHIAAACIAAGFDHFMIEQHDVVGLVWTEHTHQPDVEEPRHLCSWDKAKQYGLSGYRKEVAEPAPRTNEALGSLLGLGLKILATHARR